ncbi:MAG TPA: VOC family protein [Solirubrobacterales bacterium]
MSRLIFVNLPVRDLPASRAFFEALDFSFDDRFCDAGAACMVVSDQAWVMLLERERFADFVTKPVADPAEATALTVAVSAESREAVDAFAEAALGAGASASKEPQDYGFLYQRSFHDLDGHLWEVMWMDPVAAEKGSTEYAAEAG